MKRLVTGIILLPVGIFFFVLFAQHYDNYQSVIHCHEEITDRGVKDCGYENPPIVIFTGDILAGSSLLVIGSVIIVKDILKRRTDDSKR